MSKDTLRYFRQEASELLEQLNGGLLQLEAEWSAATAGALLRQAHTLKGAARVVKQSELAEQVHSLEDLLENFRQSRPEEPGGLISQAFRWLDRIQLSLTRLGQTAEPPKAASTRVMRPEEPAGQRVDPNEIQALLGDVSQTYARLHDLRGGQQAWLEVAELAGGGEIEEIARREGRELAAQLDHLRRELQELHQALEQLRLLPLSSLYTTLQRTLRDAAQEMQLQARFQAQGPEVKLEESVLRLLRAALVQGVRNAIAHGIETPEQRRRAGKETVGQVHLQVERRGTWLALTLSDDGRGVDTAALAIGRSGEDGNLDRLLEGGVSTSQEVNQMSGRGVGMDVIREAAQRLGGRVRLESQPGQGFKLHLDFPVRAASLPALRVRSRDQSLLIPLESVLKVSREETPDLRDLPCLGLAAFLHWDGLARAEDIRVVVAAASGTAVFQVEAVDGMVQTLVYPLPALAPCHPAISGAALDLEGRPELVLDPSRIDRFEVVARTVVATRAPARILVVDDSLTTRVMQQSILESRGFTVDLASSGSEALQKVESQAYDLFLVDAEMPGMTGFELIERLRARPREQSLPILMVSSLPRAEYEAAARQAGAQGYHEKSSFDQEELVREIRRLLT
ncbi:MAG: response regulator [Candidatus Eremiobacteraeota bacterium]|nr:response regulator [Candidatus Eremiobacteraeota bacterium]MCW5869765.1 response regulator [Candidatus Eremiobacteraeota bacterium]